MEDLYDFMKRVNLFFIPVEYLILWPQNGILPTFRIILLTGSQIRKTKQNNSSSSANAYLSYD